MKKGQAAMEFLMTYGWAILVVLASIGALAYFGVLNPSKSLPSSCTIAPGFGCDDFIVTSNTVQLVLRNGLGDDLTGVGVTVGTCTATSGAVWDTGAVLGGSGGITLAGCTNGDSGARFKEDVDITYTGSSGLEHTVTGVITGRVE
jgi:hypothetical protein